MSQATLGRLNRLKVTNSNSQILYTLDKLGGDHDALLLKARDTISQENAKAIEIQEKHKNILMQNMNPIKRAQQSAAKSKLKSGWRSMNSRKLHILDLLFHLTIWTSSYSERV